MPAPDTILQLVDQFASQFASYRSQDYNEAQARSEFIEPFFYVLGWDVYNKQGYAYSYKDVIFEDSIKVGGATKAPDYAFRIGGTRKFFVEAKKPSINLKDEITPAYQLRRYAWSAKLPLSILTDFEEFAVYDCRPKPDKTDKASTGRIMLLTYRDYSSNWDEIASVFSRQAVLKGSFDKYAEAATGKRGTAEVDDAFLSEIERWRDLLVHNLALRNPSLSQRDLNYAVQMTIDRLIFLRICEDRGIEFYGQLQSLLNGGDAYPRLCQLFRKADERYNSGLFHFLPERDQADTPDRLTPGLLLDDKPLKDILANLYYPDSPYEFSVLPADILGQVYERFLGKVIRLTAGHHAVVEDKPEVKKAGGVFYTPTFIVEYIVKNTLGKLLEGKAPGQVGLGRGTPIRILDMSCGSGSFLLGAYQYLLDWYLSGYSAEPEKWSRGAAPQLYQVSSIDGTHWKLTTSERKRILLDHIYGVDIDPQAVEVTKLSLLLKVLEGESQESIGKQLSMFRQRALPDLAGNIKCGNSLIGSDFYSGNQSTFLDAEEQYRVNAFDWQRGFAHVFANSSGFDVIIGNPPYIRIQALKEWAPLEVEFYKHCYKSASKGNYDIYVVFVEKGLSLLNSVGRLGFILPHKFFNAQYGAPLRSVLAEGKHLAKVVHFGDQQVFENATTYTCLMFLDKAGQEKFEIEKVDDMHAWRVGSPGVQGELSATRVTPTEWNFTVGKGSVLFEKLSHMPVKLGDIATRIYQGPITSADNIFLFKSHRNQNTETMEVFSKELDDWVKIESSILKRVVRSGDVGRYWAKTTAFVLFPYTVESNSATLIPQNDFQNRYPLAWAYLNTYRNLLESREKNAFKDIQWYRFGRTQNLGLWEQPKLLIPYMITNLSAYYDFNDYYYFINVTTGGYGITIVESLYTYLYLCGLLNSRLLDFYLKQVSTTFHGGYFAANKQYIEQLPIATKPSGSSEALKISSLVERMLSLHQQLCRSNTPTEKTLLQRQIDTTDRQIDAMVYELYGLTDDEIKLVEGDEFGP